MIEQRAATGQVWLETRAVPQLFQAGGLAPVGTLLLHQPADARLLEVWLQTANPLQANDLYACCYIYNRGDDTWTLRDPRYQCTGNLHASYVPEPVRQACTAYELSGATPAPPVSATAVVTPAAATVAESPRPEEPPAADELARFEGHRYWIESVAFSPDGCHVLSGSGQPIGVGQSDFDFTVRVWDLQTGKELRGFQGHTSWVTSAQFSPDGRQVLSGSYDMTVRLWDVATGREIRRFLGHTERIRSVAFSPDGRLALSGGYDRTVRLWDVATGRELRRYRGHEHWTMCVAFGPDGKLAASGGYDRTVRLWNIESGPLDWLGRLGALLGGRERSHFLGHTHTVTGVAFLPDGRRLVSSSIDRTLRLWDVATGRELRRFEGHATGVTAVAVAPDGRHVASASLDETVRLWEVETGKEVRCYRGHRDVVTSVAFAPDGRGLASGSADRTVRLWRVPDG